MLVDIGGTHLWDGATWGSVSSDNSWSTETNDPWNLTPPSEAWGNPDDAWGTTDTGIWSEEWDVHDSIVRYNTCAVHHQIEEKSTAEFEVIDKDSLYEWDVNTEVIIWDETDMSIIFGGLITDAVRTRLSNIKGGIIHKISAADYHLIPEKRIFNKAYVTPTPREVVDDILEIIQEDGVEEGYIEDDVALEDVLFPYMTCSEALNKVAELSGKTWYITEDKKLYFVSHTAYSSAWHILSEADVLKESLQISSAAPDYRNVQYVSGGKALTDLKTQHFKGDSVVKSFSLGFPLAKEPVITVNSVPVVVGIKGVELDKDWYWNEGDNTIYQDEDGTPLTATDDLEVQYYGYYKLIVRSSSAAEITRNQGVVGYGSGKVENIYVNEAIINQDAALEASRMKLLHFARMGKRLSYRTITSGLAAGTVQEITLPIFGLSAEEFLINSIDITFEGPVIWYDVNACSGPVESSWIEIFCQISNLAKESAIQNVSESDTVQGLDSFSKTWLSSEHPNPFVVVLPDALPSDPDFPGLADEDIFTYVVLYTSGSEFFRKPVVSVSINALRTEIDTTAIILAQEANDHIISHVGLWGGIECTDTPGSGIELEKHAYVKNKNYLEALQFDFTSTKGW